MIVIVQPLVLLPVLYSALTSPLPTVHSPQSRVEVSGHPSLSSRVRLLVKPLLEGVEGVHPALELGGGGPGQGGKSMGVPSTAVKCNTIGAHYMCTKQILYEFFFLFV